MTVQKREMNDPEEAPPHRRTNTRREKRTAERRYLLLVILTLVLVGGGMVALVFGPEALLTALPCLLVGVLLILVPWLLLSLLERWRERMG